MKKASIILIGGLALVEW